MHRTFPALLALVFFTVPHIHAQAVPSQVAPGTAATQNASNAYLASSGYLPDYATYSPNTFEGACATAKREGKVLMITRPNMMTGTKAYYDCEKQFMLGGMVVAAANSTIYLKGSFNCPPTQRCLDTTTNSNVNFRFWDMPPVVYADWLGSAADNMDSTALNAAVRAVQSLNTGGYGGTLKLGCRVYKLDSTVNFLQIPGLKFSGCGNGTIFRWTGGNTAPMFLISGVTNGTFEGFSVDVNHAHPLLEVIHLSEPAKGWPNKHNRFTKIFIDTDHVAGTLTYGVVIDGIDQNNDFHTFDDMEVGGFTEVGFWIKGGNTYSEIFNNVLMGGGLPGIEKVGVKTTDAKGGHGLAGSFTWHGGYMNVNEASFEIHGYSDFPIGILDFNSESAGRLLYAECGNQTVVSIERCRIVPVEFKYPDIINFAGATLRIADTFLGGADGKRPRSSEIAYHCYGGANASCGVTLSNVHIVSSNQTWNDLLHPTGWHPGGTASDLHPENYLQANFVTWQDPLKPTVSGSYGPAPPNTLAPKN